MLIYNIPDKNGQNHNVSKTLQHTAYKSMHTKAYKSMYAAKQDMS